MGTPHIAAGEHDITGGRLNAPLDDRIRETVAEILAVDLDDVPLDASAQTIAAWTSLAHLRIMAGLETAFDVKFTTDEMISMSSIQRIGHVLRAHGL